MFSCCCIQKQIQKEIRNKNSAKEDIIRKITNLISVDIWEVNEKSKLIEKCKLFSLDF